MTGTPFAPLRSVGVLLLLGACLAQPGAARRDVPRGPCEFEYVAGLTAQFVRAWNEEREDDLLRLFTADAQLQFIAERPELRERRFGGRADIHEALAARLPLREQLVRERAFQPVGDPDPQHVFVVVEGQLRTADGRSGRLHARFLYDCRQGAFQSVLLRDDGTSAWR